MIVALEKDSFSLEVEKCAIAKNISYLDAAVMVAEEKGIEIEIVSKLITHRLKSLIENDAVDLNLLPKKSQLPL